MAYLRELYQQWRSFPRIIKLFYGTDICFAFAQAIFSTLLNLHLLEIGYTASHIGTLQSIASYLMAAVAIPIGLAGDRWGRRSLYIAGSLLFAIPYMVLPMVKAFPLLMALQIVNTLGNALMMVNEPAVIAAEVDARQRAPVFSYMMVNFFLWNTLGIQMAGFLAKWLPAGALGKYQWPLVIGGVFGLGAGALRSFLPFRKQEVTPGRRLSLKPSRTTLTLGLVSILSGGFMAITPMLNVVLRERFQFGPEYISTIFTIGGILGWFGAMAVPWLTTRLGETKAYVTTIGMQAVTFVYLGLAGTVGLFLPGFWARNVGNSMQMSLGSAFTMAVVPEDERATGNSYAMVGRNIGMALMAKVYGGALATESFALPFTLAGACAAATAVVTFLAFRRHETVAPRTSGA